MLESNRDKAAVLHTYAAQAHTTAAAALRSGDHNTAQELSVKALEFSLYADEKTEAIRDRMPERLEA